MTFNDKYTEIFTENMEQNTMFKSFDLVFISVLCTVQCTSAHPSVMDDTETE